MIRWEDKSRHTPRGPLADAPPPRSIDQVKIDSLRKECPATHVIVPVEVVEILIGAGYAAYLPAFGGQESEVRKAHDAARAASNILKRASKPENKEKP